MKKSVVLLVVALIMNVAFVSAKEFKSKKSFVKTNLEFTNYLSPSSSVGELENDVIVTVRFLLTENREIVVLQTNATNNLLASYIKETLNYKKLSSNELEPGKSYVFKVNFKA